MYVVRDGFATFALENGLALDLAGSEYPTVARGCAGGDLDLPAGDTHYAMVAEGEILVEMPSLPPVRLASGMFAVLPGAGRITAEAGRVLVISRLGYTGLRQFGGPVETVGRLRYIDGCTDTLLVCPPRLGEPCLNHLHIPPGVRQTAHTHPSARVGIIVGGSGECRTPEGDFALRAGMGWYIPPGYLHHFVTTEGSLDVLAWHPDSDFGPTDEDHPMLNRTFIEKR